MSNQHEREALRGIEVQVLDLLFQVSTSEEWAELLKGPLKRAAVQGNRGLAQKLVEAGAEIEDALHAAVQGGHGGVVTDLLDSGASINAKSIGSGETPLHIAAVVDNPEMVQLLIPKGADKDALDDDGWTPLYAAAYCGHEATARALLAGGADVSIRCDEFEQSVAHVAAEDGHVDILRAAIEHEADVDAADTLDHTALHCAAMYYLTEAVNVLIEAGANIEARDGNNSTALHHAARELSLGALTALLTHGAQVNAQDSDLRPPLHRAAAKAGTQEAAEVIDVLLRSGADETIVDSNGKKAADVVARSISEEYRWAEDVERVHKLLANAPADRAWRRRGYLVMCRAHPDRIHQAREVSISRHSGTRRLARGGAKQARIEAVSGGETVGGCAVDELAGGEWADVLAKVLGLQEEGIFRTIVGYL